jgi:mono/diheme cytochrome c family protein
MRWASWGLGFIIIAVAAAALVGTTMADRKQERRIAVGLTAIALPDDPASIARGRYLFQTRGCTECHGDDGRGRAFINDGAFRVTGPQIAPGARSAVAAYRVEDWIRTIRHGVDPSGRALMVMPSEDYNRMSDADLGALIAYVKTMPAVDGQERVVALPLPVRVLYGFGMIQDAAAKIDHRLPPEAAVAMATDANYGRYVANMCIGCHGAHLSGGKIPGAPPDWPAAANLTPGEASVMPRYAKLEAFAAMLKSGKRPDGSAIAVMPFESLRRLDDTEVAALHAFLGTLAPRSAGSR